MKQLALVILTALILFYSKGALAQELGQKHNLYADIGYTPGFSLTYNYKPAKHWSFGGGIQGYEFNPTQVDSLKFIPAVIAQIRLLIRPQKKNQFFSFLDLGFDFYKSSNKYFRRRTVIYRVTNNNGFYTGLGCGYFLRITKRDGGPYVSLKIFLNWYNTDGYNYADREYGGGGMGDGSGAISIGFKF